ncbi:MAG TPA: hypothetical protein VG738_14940 [Chitinophagaceae bacterium]|nr:hypothetical protein [Chitinophagaceae bacterium]
MNFGDLISGPLGKEVSPIYDNGFTGLAVKNCFGFITFVQVLKKITAIFFFAVYLLSSTEAHQLFKLPVVFQHFAEHKKENRNISFLQFLDMHYMHGSPMDKDHDRDMQLPFKTTGDCIAIAPVFVPLTAQVSIMAPVKISGKKNYVIKHQCLLSAYLSAIWQPPKSC